MISLTTITLFIKSKKITIIFFILNLMYKQVLKMKMIKIDKNEIKITNFKNKNRKINDVNRVYIIGGIPPIPPGGIGGIPLLSFPDSSVPVEVSAFLAAIISSIRNIISAASPAD